MIRRDICVHPSCDALGPELLEALARIVPVRFKSCANLVECDRDPILSLSGQDVFLKTIEGHSCPCFHVCETNGGTTRARKLPVRFGNSTCLDARLRGRSLFHGEVAAGDGLRVKPADDVLAFHGERAVWVLRKTARASVDLVSAPPPRLTKGELASSYLNGNRFIELLPLLHFLRSVTSDLSWTQPPLRACLMFDDPNLHWTSYGFLSYEKLIQEADAAGYHVAFATIPWDAWGAHPKAVELFKHNRKVVSLLIHGNDHTRTELARPLTGERYLCLLAQSLRRIARFEAATGLRVARVMAPPHGAYSEAALAAMAALGFEGLCISTGSRRRWNSSFQLPAALGLEIGEVGSSGLPMIPRFSLSSECENDIVISGFLDRPMVLVGHHETVAKGFEALANTAAVINSIGHVQWGGPEMILRSNYLTFQQDITLSIRPYSNRILVVITEGVYKLVIDPLPETHQSRRWRWTGSGKNGSDAPSIPIQAGAAIDVIPGQIVDLTLLNESMVDYRYVSSPRFSFWPGTRRILTETRDRCSPLAVRLIAKER